MSKPQPTIEIFRPGRHTAMNGETIDFTAADVAAMAAAYDPALHEAPAVLGHPKDDDPAYAWARSLKVEDGRLVATMDQIEPAFAELVKNGRFKKISAAFYKPDTPGNPKPGKYYLRHIGFLGAMPPSVKGLKPVHFAQGDDGVLEFADNMDWPWVLRSIARLFSGFRDMLIEQKGVEVANQALGSWDIQSIEDAAARAESAQASPSYSERENIVTDATTTTTAAAAGELAEREKKLKAAEDKLKTDAAAFAERAKTARGTADAELVDQLVKAGKLAVAIKPALLAFMGTLDAEGVVTFGEGADAPKQTPREFFHALLANSGKLIEFGELSRSDGDPEPQPSDALAFGEQLAKQAVAYMAEQKLKGIVVDSDEAVRHVQKQREGN
jgi:hypothetical protein